MRKIIDYCKDRLNPERTQESRATLEEVNRIRKENGRPPALKRKEEREAKAFLKQRRALIRDALLFSTGLTLVGIGISRISCEDDSPQDSLRPPEAPVRIPTASGNPHQETALSENPDDLDTLISGIENGFRSFREMATTLIDKNTEN